MLYNFTSECAIRRVQENQDGWNQVVLIKLLVYGNDVNMLGGIVRSIEKNTDPLVVTSKVVGLEVNAEKTKYMIMSRDQNAG